MTDAEHEQTRPKMKPRFSIVIPTYNRAKLLPSAVRSVLRQSFHDFEIIISNGGSTDNTREAVKQFNDPRIRYFESEVRLPVGENYQCGLDRASGEFVTFLSDDDAYTPYLLERVNEILAQTSGDIVAYRYSRYYHDDLYDFELNIPGNSLLIANFDRAVTRFSSTEALEQVLSLHALSSTQVHSRFICPFLSNATYRRSIFDELRKKRKNLFDTVPADIYLAAAVFFVANSYYCVDEPLLVWSNWRGNSTASAQRSENKIKAHYRRLLNGRDLEHTPLKFPLALNCGANAVLEAMNDNANGEVEVDWSAYFEKTYENFTFLRSVGIETSEEESEFNEVLERQSDAVKLAVRAKLSSPGFVVKSFVNTRMPSIASRLRKIRDWNRPEQFSLIRGESAGFVDVLGASKYVK